MSHATLPPDLAAVARAERNGHTIAPPRTASVLGLGHYLPDEVVPNDPIAQRIGVDDEWILKRTGISLRHRAAPGESLTELATRAGHDALRGAVVDPGDLDLPEERVADYIGYTGNTSAASIPLTLGLLREDGRLHAEQRLLVAAIGAGFTWGAGTIEWGIDIDERSYT